MINIQLNYVKCKTDNDITILDSLTFVIMIEDFYQFLPIVKKFLWNKSITIKKNYDKEICDHFTSVIILIKQMRQNNNKSF